MKISNHATLLSVANAATFGIWSIKKKNARKKGKGGYGRMPPPSWSKCVLYGLRVDRNRWDVDYDLTVQTSN